MTAPVWMAAPPEVHSALLSSGPGPGPLLAAAGAWSSLGAEYDSVAAELSGLLGSVQAGAWQGPSAEQYVAAHVPYLAWLLQASADSAGMAAQHETAAAAYTAAVAAMPTLVELAANHASHAVLLATNFFGINTIPIALNEANYVRMWVQAATVMSTYQAVSSAAVAAAPAPPTAPQVVKSDAASRPPSAADNTLGSSPLIQQLSQLFNQLLAGPDPLGLNHLVSQLGLSQLFSQLENFEGGNSVLNLILPGNPFTPYPVGTTFQQALSNIFVSFTQGTFVYDPQTLVFAHSPSQLISEFILFGIQLITHRLTDIAQLLFNFPGLLGAAIPALTAPVGGLAGFSGLAGLAVLTPPVLPAPAAVVPIFTPPPDPQLLVGIAPVPAPPVALAAPVPAAAPPVAAPPPPLPPPVTGAEAFAFPYLVGGPSIGWGSGMSTSAGETARKTASRPDAAASTAAAVATREKRRTRRRRPPMRGHGDEYMDMNVEVEPDWGTAPEGEPTGSATASDRGAGPLGFAGAAGRADTAAGLATLVGDTFGGGPKTPMVPNSWNPDADDPPADTGKAGAHG
ncbi:MAG: PPE domain-containing protein [Mycobacterium sp.]